MRVLLEAKEVFLEAISAFFEAKRVVLHSGVG
jgi:hypothetical protein